jgi:hypothetical protein
MQPCPSVWNRRDGKSYIQEKRWGTSAVLTAGFIFLNPLHGDRAHSQGKRRASSLYRQLAPRNITDRTVITWTWNIPGAFMHLQSYGLKSSGEGGQGRGSFFVPFSSFHELALVANKSIPSPSRDFSTHLSRRWAIRTASMCLHCINGRERPWNECMLEKTQIIERLDFQHGRGGKRPIRR